ncbi:MAG TPA: 30S ribosome-binding factor RbfA [Blastocatellia bacterium]|nr:30S ribosome-binding factor RbfA [Blastocatellia bacterium]HMV86782.1 30S ribosome-binding factor RbfA [Blastocatellia bacterium]HMX25438.1 30S ribosome-binding factor RbfA [Blastocatellia bacterium]HMY72160.1 30S ribosome-binding factor RbfA [Blastocatellia bacterium]HMZ19486.1 30S ribosome-binding factor RbfA [Blastocatellia bacterium]
MQHRPVRLAQELKSEISSIITRELPHHRLGFITITEVKVSPDLRYARVFISVLGSAEDRQRTLNILKEEKAFIRQLIGRRFRLRHTPELTFIYDETVENADHMMRLMDDIKKEMPDEGKDEE